MKGCRTFRYRKRQRLDPRSANKGPNRFPDSEADNLRGPGMLPREDRHQVPAVHPDLYDEPRKNTKRRAASIGRSSPPPYFEGDTFKGFKVRRVDLSKAPHWQIEQVDNTEFEEGWRTTFKIMEEFEKCSAHLPRFDGIPEVCSDSPCSICLRKGHSTDACSYHVSVPLGATVSRGYEIVCKACPRTDIHQHTLEGIPRRVVMKFCIRCHWTADHWPEDCWMKKENRKQGEFGSTSQQGHEQWQQ